MSREQSRWQRFLASDFFYEFRRSPVTVVSFVVVTTLILMAVLADVVAPTNPFDPASLNLMNGFTPPMEPNAFTGETFLFGTDDQGRDVAGLNGRFCGFIQPQGVPGTFVMNIAGQHIECGINTAVFTITRGQVNAVVVCAGVDGWKAGLNDLPRCRASG